MKKFKSITLGILASLFIMSCESDDSTETGNLTIKLDHNASIGDNLTDGADNSFTLTKLRYIVTDITLIDENDNETVLSNDTAATMVDLSDATDGIVYKELTDVPQTTISGLKFKIGVSEEIHSAGEEEQGVLYDLALETEADDTNMFWSWALGYIYLKFEGEYSATTSHDDSDTTDISDDSHDHVHTAINTSVEELTPFQTHIGNTGSGDTRTDRVMEVEIDFHGENVTYDGSEASIHLAIDVEKMLTAATSIDVTTYVNIHTFSDAISENVEAGVFSYSHQH